MNHVFLRNPTDKELTFPLNGIKLPSKKWIKVEQNEAVHILNTWKFIQLPKDVKKVGDKPDIKVIKLEKKTKEDKKAEKKEKKKVKKAKKKKKSDK